MQNKIKRLIKELGIEVKYSDITSNGFFGYKKNKAIIVINENLSEIITLEEPITLQFGKNKFLKIV